MRAIGLLALLLVFAGGCTTRASSPAFADPAHESIVFLEKPGGVHAWDFEVHGLPATDVSTGELVVPDLSHGYIASGLSLSILWLRPGRGEPARHVTVLDGGDASRVLYEVDPPDDVLATEVLARSVRAKTADVNRVLAGTDLRPTAPCRVESDARDVRCVHPQRLTCGEGLVAEMRGDTLTWRRGGESGTVMLGWEVAPMTIGDGPPKEMITCVREAHLDPVTMRVAARVEVSCRDGGGDACFFPDTWRAVALR